MFQGHVLVKGWIVTLRITSMLLLGYTILVVFPAIWMHVGGLLTHTFTPPPWYPLSTTLSSEIPIFSIFLSWLCVFIVLVPLCIAIQFTPLAKMIKRNSIVYTTCAACFLVVTLPLLDRFVTWLID